MLQEFTRELFYIAIRRSLQNHQIDGSATHRRARKKPIHFDLYASQEARQIHCVLDRHRTDTESIQWCDHMTALKGLLYRLLS